MFSLRSIALSLPECPLDRQPDPLYARGMSGYYGSDCPPQMANPQAWWKDGKPVRVVLGNLPRTWRHTRLAELWRRGYGVPRRIVFPKARLRVARLDNVDAFGYWGIEEGDNDSGTNG